MNITPVIAQRRSPFERKGVCDACFVVSEPCKEVLYNILHAFKQTGIYPRGNIHKSNLVTLVKHLQGDRGRYADYSSVHQRISLILSRWQMTSLFGITLPELLNIILCDENFTLRLPQSTEYELMIFTNPREVDVAKHPMYFDQMTFVQKKETKKSRPGSKEPEAVGGGKNAVLALARAILKAPPSFGG